MRRLAKQIRWKVLGVALFMVAAGAAGLLTRDAPEVRAAVTFRGLAGAGEGGISINVFLPDRAIVRQGDTIEWTNPYEEPHTISYGNLPPGDPAEPHDVAVAANFDGTHAFSSGFLVKNQKFNVTFTRTGAFKFVCLIHPGMEVDVFVLGPGAFVPPQDDASSQAVKDTIARALAQANQAISQLRIPAPARNPDGTSTHTVLTGPAFPFEGSDVGVAVMKFYSARTQIGVGDTVVWTAETFVPHTVTFIPPGGPPANLNPFQTVPAPTLFNGNQFVNGIFGGVPVFSQSTRFSMTFREAGTYSYVCLLHADQGMAGVIVVGPGGGGAAGGGAIRPPSTGDAGLLDAGSGTGFMYAGLLLLLPAAVAGAYAAVKR